MAGDRPLDPGMERRLGRAAKFVEDYWFPANPSLLQNIRKSVQQDTYHGNVARLVEDIQSDYALFMSCLRELANQLQKEGVEIPRVSPVELMEWSGMTRLVKVLEESSDKPPSKHSLDGASPLQAQRMREFLIAKSSIEALAEKFSVEESTASSAAMLRQFGLMLVTWNYPGVYEAAVRELRHTPSTTLDVLLAQKLGFSPTVLAISIFERWGFPVDYLFEFGLSDTEQTPELEDDAALIGGISDLCRVGEALARANCPDVYPSAKRDWQFAKEVVEERLGRAGLRYIYDRVMENCENYLLYIPEVFDGGLVEFFENSEGAASPSSQNPFIRAASPSVSRQLHSLYRKLSDGATSQELLREFVHSCIPACHISGGCIFTVEPAEMVLIPQMEFGDVKLRSIAYVDYSIVQSNSDMVAVAYQGGEPVIEYKMGKDARVYTAISGVFGAAQRFGVLYIEIPDSIAGYIQDERVLHFQALRYALNDVLRLV